MAGPWRVKFVEMSIGDVWEPDDVRRFMEQHGFIPWPRRQTHADDPEKGGVHVICPLCYRMVGAVNFEGHGHGQIEWQFNGDYDQPTVIPSVLAHKCGLHVFVRDGQIIDAGTPAH